MTEMFKDLDKGPVIREKLNSLWNECRDIIDNGVKGWSPLIRSVEDGDRVVLEVYDWINGVGVKPVATGFIGTTGFVTTAAQAVNVRGAQGLQGVQGAKGDQGVQGLQGVQGAKGDDATIAVGTVTTGEADTPVQITNVGTANAAIFDFTIPKGKDGNGMGAMPVQSFVGDGVKTSFPLSNPPATESNTQVYFNGIYQNKSTYNLVSGSIVFTEPPTSGVEIEVVTILEISIGTTTAAQTSIVDSGNYFSSGSVEGALQEVGDKINSIKDAILSYPTYFSATAAATTLPDGQLIKAPNSDGRVSFFSVQTGTLVFKDYAPDIIRLQSYSELRSYTGKAETVNITTQGIAGLFNLDALDTTSGDNGGTVIVDTSGKRWKRVVGDAPIQVSWFGAKGDGSDDTLAIQSALSASPYLFVTGGSKQYTVKSLNLVSGQRVCTLYLKTLAGAEDFVSPITIDGRTTAKSDIIMIDVKVDGNRANQTAIDSASEDGGRHGFRILGHVSNVYVSKSEANYCGTDGVELFSYVVSWPAFQNIVFEDCRFNWNRRHGGSGDSTSGVQFIRCEFLNNGQDLNGTSPLNSGNRGSRQLGSLYGNGFDAESYGAGSHCVDLQFIDCDMTENARAGLLLLNNGNDYGTLGWKPYAGIKIIRGRYDAGTQTYSGKMPIVFDALNFDDTKRAFSDIEIKGTYFATGGPSLKYVQSARIECQAIEYEGGYHASVISCDDVVIDLGLVVRPAVVYIFNANPVIAQPFTGKDEPTLTAFQGCTVSEVSVSLIGGDNFSGQEYRITGNVTQTATGSAGWMAIGGGRTLLDAKIYALNPNTGLPCITGFNPSGYIGINSGTVAQHNFVATVKLR